MLCFLFCFSSIGRLCSRKKVFCSSRLLRAKMFSKKSVCVLRWDVLRVRKKTKTEKSNLLQGDYFHGEGRKYPLFKKKRNKKVKTTSTRHKYKLTVTKKHTLWVVGFWVLPLYLVLVVSASPLWWTGDEWPFTFRSEPYEDALLILDMPIAFTISR